jgi:putative redox protein
MPVTATWQKKMEFQVDFPEGESITLTSVPLARRPGKGPNPMQTVLAALVGCTGMDVVMILTKMRKDLEALRIEVDAVRREEEPRIYTHLTLTYHIDGAGVDAAAAKRAVALSQDKYCSVSAMLRPTVELDYRIILNGEPVSVD